jgi:hypothetical protein
LISAAGESLVRITSDTGYQARWNGGSVENGSYTLSRTGGGYEVELHVNHN